MHVKKSAPFLSHSIFNLHRHFDLLVGFVEANRIFHGIFHASCASLLRSHHLPASTFGRSSLLKMLPKWRRIREISVKATDCKMQGRKSCLKEHRGIYDPSKLILFPVFHEPPSFANDLHPYTFAKYEKCKSEVWIAQRRACLQVQVKGSAWPDPTPLASQLRRYQEKPYHFCPKQPWHCKDVLTCPLNGLFQCQGDTCQQTCVDIFKIFFALHNRSNAQKQGNVRKNKTQQEFENKWSTFMSPLKGAAIEASPARFQTRPLPQTKFYRYHWRPLIHDIL